MTGRQARRRAPTTIAAAALMLLLCLHFGVSAAQSLLLATRGAQLDLATRRELSLVGMDLDRGPAVLAITGAVVLVLVTLAAVAAVGLLARRGWGREATGLFAFVFAFVAIPLAVAGLRTGAPDAWEGVAAGLANVIVLGLVLAPRTASDVADAERHRIYHRHDHPRRGRPR
jgi:hypothetical protein